MTLEDFRMKRKFDIMRQLRETSTLFGFRNYTPDKYDRDAILEISCDMDGSGAENEAFNIFCLGFYRGRMYEKERHIEKAPE